MKSKPTRTNRFKKNKPARRALLRDRVVLVAKGFLGALALVATSAAFIFAYDFFTQTRHFQVSQIVVTGMQRLSRLKVMEIAGVGPQTNILSVNLATTRSACWPIHGLPRQRSAGKFPRGCACTYGKKSLWRF